MTFQVTVQFAVLTCCVRQCALAYGVPQQWLAWRHSDHALFYCPNGHAQSFPPSAEELEARRVKQLQDEEASRVRAQQLAATRQRRASERAARLKNATVDAQLVRVVHALRRYGQFQTLEAVQEWLRECEAAGDRTSLHQVGPHGIALVRNALAVNQELFCQLMWP